jgi:O-antigen ligase
MRKSINKTTDINNYKMLTLFLFLLFFSNATLRTEIYLIFYIGLSLIICVYAYFKVLFRPSRLSKTLANGLTLWVVVLFFMYFFYGLALPIYAYFNLKYFFFIFIIMLVTMLIIIDVPIKDLIEVFIRVCAFTSIAVSIFIVINEWSSIMSGGIRIGDSGSGNVNTVANYLGIMSIPSLYKVIFEKKTKYLIPYIVSVIIMLLTGSKQALIYIIFSLVILSILRNGLKLYKYFLPLLLVTVVIFLIFNNETLYNIIGHRVIDFIGSMGGDIEGANESHSTETRLLMIKLGLDAFMSKPIFGGGWFYFASYSGLGTYSHNNYLELLSTYGLIGFIVYYSMFFIVLIRLKSLMKVDNYSKMFFVIILIMFFIDTASVSFSINVLNYLVLVFGYVYVKTMKEVG